MIAAVGIKKAVAGVMSAAAAIGVTPSDVSDSLSILLGLVVGTVGRAVYDGRDGTKLPRSWWMFQLGILGLVWLVLFAATETLGLSGRMLPAAAGLSAFFVRNWLQRKAQDIDEGRIG